MPAIIINFLDYKRKRCKDTLNRLAGSFRTVREIEKELYYLGGYWLWRKYLTGEPPSYCLHYCEEQAKAKMDNIIHVDFYVSTLTTEEEDYV